MMSRQLKGNTRNDGHPTDSRSYKKGDGTSDLDAGARKGTNKEELQHDKRFNQSHAQEIQHHEGD